MPKTVTWTSSLRVQPDDLELSATCSFTAEGICVVDADIAAGAKDREVLAQPGGDSKGEVNVLVILSNSYSKLTFTVNVPSSDASNPAAVTLDAPLMLVGAGSVARLAGAALSRLYFTNESQAAAAVQVLVSRDIAQ